MLFSFLRSGIYFLLAFLLAANEMLYDVPANLPEHRLAANLPWAATLAWANSKCWTRFLIRLIFSY
jgi:hypothetical protein